MNTIVLTGGGTGGHVIPALALVPYLRRYFSQVYYVGASGGVEETLAEGQGIPFFGTEVVKFDRRRLWRDLAIPRVLHRASTEAARFLTDVGCGVVFSKGGYCALPTVLAAHRLGIPIVCHESDRTVGLANRLTLRYTSHLITSFEDTRRGVCLGNPIRDAVFEGRAANVTLPLPHAPMVLVMGGSMGALALNTLSAELAAMAPRLNVVNLYGRSPVACACANYIGMPFVDNVADYYARAAVVVCRAGANTLFELAALGLPTIAVPLPKSGASRGDQVQNAAYFARQYGFTVLSQSSLDAPTLLSAVTDAIAKGREGSPAVSSPNAAIARYVYDVFAGGRETN